MAKFRCKVSGGIMEFHNEYDIEQLRKQEDYEEVVEAPVEEPKRARVVKQKEEA